MPVFPLLMVLIHDILSATFSSRTLCIDCAHREHQPGVRAVARSLTNKEGEPLAFTATKGVSMLTADVTVPSSLPAVVNG